MKTKANPFLRTALLAALATATLATTQAADVTFSSTATFTDTQTYDNGTTNGATNVVTLDSGANYTFNGNFTAVGDWNRLTLNDGATLTVTGSVFADTTGFSLNGGTLTTGGLQLMDMPPWAGTYADGKQSIEYGDSIINGTTVVASQPNAAFIQKTSSPRFPNDAANNLFIGNDGATINSNGNDIGITMILADFPGQAGSLTKTGAGTLTLTQANTYTGGTTVSDGTLAMGSVAPFNCPIQGGLTVNTGGILRLSDVGFGYAGTGVSTVSLNAASIVVDSVNSMHMGFNGQTNLYLADGSSITPATAGNTVQFATKNIDSIGNSQNTISANLNLRTEGVVGQHTFYVDDGAAATDLLVSGNLSDRFPELSWDIASLTKTGTGTMVISGTNTYDGDTTVNDGTLEFTSTSQLQFAVTDAPASNMVTGSGTATFNGTFNINTDAVSGTTGHIWLLVDRATLTGEFFDTSFSVAGFTPQGDGVTWTMSDAKGTWSFSETTGELTLDVGSDYDAWKTANSVTGGENDDDDSDGLTNHEEYVFGLDPTGGSSVNPITEPFNKTAGTFTYTRRDPSLPDPTLTYSVWTSTDLSTWTEDTGAVEGITTLNGKVQTVPVTISPALLTNPKLFIQVRAN